MPEERLFTSRSIKVIEAMGNDGHTVLNLANMIANKIRESLSHFVGGNAFTDAEMETVINATESVLIDVVREHEALKEERSLTLTLKPGGVYVNQITQASVSQILKDAMQDLHSPLRFAGLVLDDKAKKDEQELALSRAIAELKELERMDSEKRHIDAVKNLMNADRITFTQAINELDYDRQLSAEEIDTIRKAVLGGSQNV